MQLTLSGRPRLSTAAGMLSTGLFCIALLFFSSAATAAPQELAKYNYAVAGQEADTPDFAVPAGINRTIIVTVHAQTDSGTEDYVTVDWAYLDGDAGQPFTLARSRTRSFSTSTWQGTTMLYRHVADTFSGDAAVRIRMAENLTEDKVVHVWVMSNMDHSWTPVPADGNGDAADGLSGLPRILNFDTPADYLVMDAASLNTNANITGRAPVKSFIQRNLNPPLLKGISGARIQGTTSEDLTYSYTSASSDWTMVAVRFRAAYVIESSTGANGTISPLGEVPVPSGDNQAFNINAFSGYVISQLLVDGAPVEAAAGLPNYVYTFENVTQNHTIEVIFSGQPEILVIPTAISMECDAVGYTAEMALDGVSADDPEDGSLTDDIVVSGVIFPLVAPGVYTILYDVTDSDGTPAEQEQRVVTIEDTLPPEILGVQASPLMIECGLDTFEHLAFAVDQCDGDVDVDIAGDIVDEMVVGTYIITYTAVDNAGLSAGPVQLEVNVVDTTGPAITLLGDNPVVLDGGAWYEEAGASAWDACEGDVGAVAIDDSAVNTGSLGTYQVSYSASDSWENETVVYRDVIVQRVDCALIVTAATTDVTALPGEQVTLAVELAPGSCAVGEVVYEWKKQNGDKDAGFITIPSAPNAPTLTISNATEEDSGIYRCDVSDDMYTVPSPEINLTVGTGLPATGMAGLALIAAMAALAGVAGLRKRN